MKKHALVAGGAGFIGSHLCELLLEQNRDVTVVDNLVTGRRKNIEHLFARGLKFIECDINLPLNYDTYLGANFGESFAGQVHEIYNLASPASPVDFTRIPVFIMDTASKGHRNLLELARSHKARILFASTSEVYGDALVHPQPESYCGNVNPVGPRGCYDEAKRFGEALSIAYWRQFKLDIRIARIFNTYGPRMRPDDGRIIPNFFSQALAAKPLTVYGEGKQTRSFCFVTDLVAGLFALMQSDEIAPVNIGNPIEMTVVEIANRINVLTGNKAPHSFLDLPTDDPKQRCPDITRAQRILQWRPFVELEGGLAATFEYFKKELS